ncbi:dTDP-4-amino-4,6-dideoxygalactose transaminase [Candidatus Hartigia pinicola]|nr:dTDP-4-amino-4,6-dideoxygalactose transaminase [Candidatus Hartigia pinicola]
MIPVNKPPIIGTELAYIKRAIKNGKLCSNSNFVKLCEEWMEKRFNCLKVQLTPSCTASLEMAAILINAKSGDEVIMPSFTFVSTSNAFVLRGTNVVFVDIRPDTMNLDETKIEAAITERTRAIIPVHYAGVACDMDAIMAIAKKHNLFVIEDAAQGVMSTYKGRALGTIGHIGCYSFHKTKNYSSGGEGGATLINDKSLIIRAEIIREKGTNRSQFLRGQVDKYTWCDIGSSYLLSDLQAAYLWAQFEHAEKINDRRLLLWQRYYDTLSPLEEEGKLILPIIVDSVQHNAHIFYIKLKNMEQGIVFNNYMKSHNILTVFHYVALHSSPAGKKFTRFHGEDHYTTRESNRLIRLPIFYNMSDEEQKTIIIRIKAFFS